MAVGNPTVPYLDQATAEALGGTVHAGSGLQRFAYLDDENSSPSFFSKWMNLWHAALDHIAGSSQGRVLALSGLNVGVFKFNYRIGATDYAYLGDTTFACTANETNHLYLDTDETLKNDTTGWPGGDHIKLAKVVCGASAVTSVADMRFANFMAGIVNAWASVAATQAVDLDDFGLIDLGAIKLSAATELTVASGVITPTRIWHTVDTESDAPADDIVTITADASQVGRLLILQAVSGARVPTIKSTGNIDLVDFDDLVLDANNKLVVLKQHTATSWVVVRTNFNDLSSLVRNLDCNGKQLLHIGGLNLSSAEVQISGGAITLPSGSRDLLLRSEVEFNPDTLVTINGGSDDDELWLRTGAAAVGEAITLDDGGGNISLIGGDWVMLSDAYRILLKRRGGVWEETLRTPLTNQTLAALGHAMPYPIVAHYPGTLSDNQATFNMRVAKAFTMTVGTGKVVTAPTGGSCVVDVLKNGSSIFGSPASAINILESETAATSATVSVSFAVNDVMTIKILSANGAVSLTVAIDAHASVGT